MFIVDTLPDEQLRQLVIDVFPILGGICNGEIETTRKNDFARGKSRRNLMFNAGVEKFTEDQHSFVLSVLLSSFKSEETTVDENFIFLV